MRKSLVESLAALAGPVVARGYRWKQCTWVEFAVTDNGAAWEDDSDGGIIRFVLHPKEQPFYFVDAAPPPPIATRYGNATCRDTALHSFMSIIAAEELAAHCEHVATPFMNGASWHRLEFTPEDYKAMGGDPDVAFQCELGDWIIRMDYAREIGNWDFHWKRGQEAACVADFELFAHGKPARPATAEEIERYRWALAAAIRSWISGMIERAEALPQLVSQTHVIEHEILPR